MPANVYECMFILDTNKLGGRHTAVSKQLHTILEKNNAEVLASRPWMNQDLKLALPDQERQEGAVLPGVLPHRGQEPRRRSSTTSRSTRRSCGA